MGKFTLFRDEDEAPEALPTRWEICDRCDGHGKSSSHLGAFTAEEINEDPDFAEDYFAGHYDRACEACNGSGKVEVLDERRLTKEQREAWEKQDAIDREIEAESRAERMAEHYMDCRAAGVDWWRA